MQSSTLFRCIGATVRSTVTGTSVAVIVVLLNILGSGFLLLREQIPVWWRWIIWVAPLHYIFQGLTNNEFLGESYEDAGKLDPRLAPQGIGRLVLATFQVRIANYWRCAATCLARHKLSRCPLPAVALDVLLFNWVCT
jgi:ABC-2 type transporter